MQFQYNSDLPGVDQAGNAVPAVHKPPSQFPRVKPLTCAKITTRIYHPARNQVATVQNVIVTTMQRPTIHRENSDSSVSSIHSSSSDEDMQSDPPEITYHHHDRAYWIQRTIRDAIYGRVLFALVLKQRAPSQSPNDNAEWEVTNQFCAIKEMSWQHIRKEKSRLVEDPIKEVAAMQYMKYWYETQTNVPIQAVEQSFQAIMNTNIMMPLDLLTDDRCLYSVMPYCDGGELFDRLDTNERFSEPEARYWMVQLLNGLENLQRAGICHRDVSLENLMVHKSGALIIDLGMCIKIPARDENLSQTFSNMSMQEDGTRNSPPLPFLPSNRTLITPQGTCGKWLYMSPEIYLNKTPFDGFAVDMWAAGVILFLMLTGFPPWERACQTDERFKYMTAGYLVQMLTEWKIPISADAMDLLQRMLFLDPRDRLSLEQVKAHPWMTNGSIHKPEMM